MKGFVNRPNGLSTTCFELTEESVKGSGDYIELFPQTYNSVALPWDLKYSKMMDTDDNLVLDMVRQMWEDPNFMTRAITSLSFYDPK